MYSRIRDIKYLRWLLVGAEIFSTCAKRQYMAIVLDKDGYLVSSGYNGAPKGLKHCKDGGCPRLFENSASGTVYDNCTAIHAEQNALLHSDFIALKGGTLLVNGPPCFTCAKLISNSGVERLVYIYDESYGQWSDVKAFLINSGITLTEYKREDVCVDVAGQEQVMRHQFGVLSA